MVFSELDVMNSAGCFENLKSEYQDNSFGYAFIRTFRQWDLRCSESRASTNFLCAAYT